MSNDVTTTYNRITKRIKTCKGANESHASNWNCYVTTYSGARIEKKGCQSLKAGIIRKMKYLNIINVNTFLRTSASDASNLNI